MAFSPSVNGGTLETDLRKWTPMHEEDETSHHDLMDPGLNPEEALIAREEHQDEEDDGIDHLDGVANPKTTRSEFLPEEQE